MKVEICREPFAFIDARFEFKMFATKRATQLAGHENGVATFCAGSADAPDLWNRSNQRDRNEPAIRVGGGFAACNGDVVTGAKTVNALIKLLDPGDVKIARERQCDQCSSRFSAHRGDIAQAAPEGFVTDLFRVGGWLKMNSLDDRICFEKEITVGNAEVEHSAVIAGSDENALVSGKLFGQSLDEFEFVHGSRTRQSAGQSVSTRC